MTTTLETSDGSCKFYRVQVNGLKTIVTYVSGRMQGRERRGEEKRRERKRRKEIGECYFKGACDLMNSRHGKVGSEGQDNEVKHSSTSEASTYAEDLIDKLQNNGYEKTNNKRKRGIS